MKRTALTIVLLCAAAQPGAAASMSREDAGPSFTWREAPQRRDVEARLESLDPSKPMEYFELAEELADMPRDPEALRHARHLFGLAALLDRDRLGRSACLALAELSDDPSEQRRLLALSGLLGDARTSSGLREAPGAAAPAGGAPVDLAGVHRRTAAPSPAAILALGEAFSYSRRGLGSRAQGALREAGAMQLVEQLEPFIGGTARFLEDIRAMRGTARPSRVDPQELKLMRVELGLLEGSERSWSTDLVLTRGETLIEIDAENLAGALGIDGTRTLYRHGAWVAPPRGQARN